MRVSPLPGSPAPAPAPVPAPAPQPAPSVPAIVSRAVADQVYDAIGVSSQVSKDDFFKYGVQSFSHGAISSPNEWSALIANLAHESAFFSTTIEDGCTSKCAAYYEPTTWDGSVTFPGDTANHCFCGRGYIQLSHSANYYSYSKAAFNGNGLVLLDQPGPEMVASDPVHAWGSALWYWSQIVHPTFSPTDFAKSVQSIYSPIECSGTSAGLGDTEAKARFDIYKKVLAIAAPTAGAHMNCPLFSL